MGTAEEGLTIVVQQQLTVHLFSTGLYHRKPCLRINNGVDWRDKTRWNSFALKWPAVRIDAVKATQRART